MLHFLAPEVARRSVATFAGALAAGSYLIISVGYDGGAPGDQDFTDAYNAQHGPRIYRQSREGVSRLFDGLDLVPPGIADVSAWRAEWHEVPRPERGAMILGGVGRVPGRSA